MAADSQDGADRIVRAKRTISAPAARIFELIADPAKQPDWDGNDNLAEAAEGQRVRSVGDVFTMTITKGVDRANEAVEFAEGELIAWRPSVPGEPAPGHLWRWEIADLGDGTCDVIHTYDWTDLTDTARMERAAATTSEWLERSIDRLAAVAER
ncbi:SRPBCC family protein [Dietzia timorensis]|uniref:Polyketide cyclase n=1 Tax=Dietzia timorensis TaxID=499555 RepID=A0A173LQQ2_9ACTN|nr:SRPBCC family protein [Dietzia timorensis]ANI93737.1 Hypothetical protein BJL86_2978 [Dietzia timorensis]